MTSTDFWSWSRSAGPPTGSPSPSAAAAFVWVTRGLSGRRLPERIHSDFAFVRSLTAIAQGLNDDGIPTTHGASQWYPSTVRSIVKSEQSARPEAA